MSGIQLTENFTLSAQTTLGELAQLFKTYNSKLSTLKIGDLLIVMAMDKEMSKAVQQAVEPLMDSDDEG